MVPAFAGNRRSLPLGRPDAALREERGIFADPSNRVGVLNDPTYWKPGAISFADTDTTRFYRVTYAYNAYIAKHDGGSPVSQTAIPQVANTVLMGPAQNWYNWNSCQVVNGVAGLYWNVSTRALWLGLRLLGRSRQRADGGL